MEDEIISDTTGCATRIAQNFIDSTARHVCVAIGIIRTKCTDDDDDDDDYDDEDDDDDR